MEVNIISLFEEIDGCPFCEEKDEWYKFIQTFLSIEDFDTLEPVWSFFKSEHIHVDRWKKEVSKVTCPICEHPLSLGAMLFEDEDSFRDELVEKIAERVSQDIAGCSTCNDEEILYEQKHGNPDKLREANEVCTDFGVPDDLYDSVVKLLHCSCGETLTEYDPIVTREDVDRWYGDIADILINTFTIAQTSAEEFTEYLHSFPMLGIHHDVGKRIYQLIKDREIPGIQKIKQGTILFRARKRNRIDRMVPYIADELWAPPPGYSRHGRYNPVGVPYLYLANTEQTALEEIHPEYAQNEVAEIAEFILLEDFLIWDVRDLDINEFIAMPSINHGNLSKEYVFPNFLAQCCAAVGIHGIQYESIKDKTSWNIALFDYKERETIVINNIFVNQNRVRKDLPSMIELNNPARYF